MIATAPRILLADDHPLVVQALVLLLQGALPHATTVQATDAAQVEARLDGCDAALIDLHMPGTARGRFVAQLAQRHPHVPLVLISGLIDTDVARELLSLSSVHAFVPKSAAPSVIFEALQAALRGERLGALPEQSNDASRLPPRLAQVRLLLRQGKTNKDIAREMDISVGTVKNYLTDLYRVLRVSNRVQATLPGEHE